MPVIIPDDLIKKAKEAAGRKRYQVKNQRKKILPLIRENDGVFDADCPSAWNKAEEEKTIKKIFKKVHRMIRATRKPSYGRASLHALTEVLLDFEAIRTGQYILIDEE